MAPARLGEGEVPRPTPGPAHSVPIRLHRGALIGVRPLSWRCDNCSGFCLADENTAMPRGPLRSVPSSSAPRRP